MEQLPKVAIVGSRSFRDYELLRRTMDEQKATAVGTVVSGGAAGADRLAERYARERWLRLVVLRPDWGLIGWGAGFARNTDVVAAADVVFAFWDGRSSGTRDVINKAKKAGKPVIVVPV